MVRQHPRSTRTDTLFPYKTLFRSAARVAGGAGQWKMLIRDMAAPAKGRRDMAPNGDACPSWGGMKRRRVARRGSPAVVVQREVGDDLAPLQIEAAEVGQPLEAATLEHSAALAGVVEIGRAHV